MRAIRFAAMLLIVLLFSACAHGRGAGGPGHEAVSHVVVCWLKNPGSPEDRARLITAAKSLEPIPGIVSLEVGECLPSKREIVDSTFDVAMVVQFRDEKALEEYLVNPIHVQAVKDHLVPLTSKVLIYDYHPH
jgi:hypothetical protein